MELSKEQLNKIYADKRNRHLSLFLGACEREIVNDEWGSSLSMSHQYLPDQEVLDLVDWWKKKQSEQKYTVKVGPGNYGYLVVDYDDFDISILGLVDTQKWQSKFTKQEIENLKQCNDFAIDWDKAIIEPVEESK